jgi:hypothetical protein
MAVNILDSLYPDCEVVYDTTLEGHQPPNAAVYITGVASYGQGQYLDSNELEAMRRYLSAGGMALIFGLNNVSNLPPHAYLGCQMITRDPWQTDSLWGCPGSIFEDMVFMYDESEYLGAYYMMEFDLEAMNCLEGQYGMSGSPRAVQFENPDNGSKTVTINMDLALVTEGRNNAEDLIEEVYVSFFGYNPSSIGDNANSLPGSPQLIGNYPNPFNASTTIHYYIPTDGNIKIAIYDILGRRIKTLTDGFQTAGKIRQLWDGLDNSGDEVPTGVYFCRLTAGSFQTYAKMTLIR